MDVEVEEGRIAKIHTPFEYKSINYFSVTLQHVYQSMCFVAESQLLDNFYFFMHPLRPCIGIMVRNHRTGKMLVAHQDFPRNIESIREHIHTIGDNNLQDLSVRLFTATYDGYESKFQAFYQGRTQKEELLKLKNWFCENFNLTRDHVRAQIFRSECNEFLGDYMGADASMLINSQGEIFSISYYKENFANARIDVERQFSGKTPFEKRRIFAEGYEMGCNQRIQSYCEGKPEFCSEEDLRDKNHGDLYGLYNFVTRKMTGKYYTQRS
jgi:hypothetical protein